MQDLDMNPRIFWWLLPAAFLLHAVAMNLALGSGLIAAAASLRAEEAPRRLLAWLVRLLPGALGWTLATGILALGVLDATPGAATRDLRVMSPFEWGFAGIWPVLHLLAISLVALILIRRLAHQRSGRAAASSGAGAAVLLGVAGLLCATALRSGPPIPRALHLLLGAVAVAGMAVAVHGWIRRRGDPAYACWAARHGAIWFTIPTALQMVVGFWFLLAIPEPIRGRFLGGSTAATVLLGAGVALAIALLVVMTQASGSECPSPLVPAGAALLGGVLLVMALLREQARPGPGEGLPAAAPPLGVAAAALLAAFTLAQAAGMALWLRRRLLEPPAATPPPAPAPRRGA